MNSNFINTSNTGSNTSPNKSPNKSPIAVINRVQPLEWVLPNKKEFPEWIYRTFIKYELKNTSITKNQKQTKNQKPTKKVFTPFPYQNFLRDYLQGSSPYRGILLYHGLGSGKTCTSIHIAESLKDEKNVVVLLPASIEPNFIEYGLKFCGDKKYQANANAYKDKYSFIRFNASNVQKQFSQFGSLDNHTIIIDETHNLVSIMMSGILGNSKNGKFIYDQLINAKNVKIIALTGTPVVNAPFELAVLFNVLRGYLEVSVFRIMDETSTKPNYEKIKTEIEKLEYVDFVEYNVSSQEFRVHIMVLHYDPLYNGVCDAIEEIGHKHKLDLQYSKQTNQHNKLKGPKQYPLFPDEVEGGESKDFNTIFIKEEQDGTERLVNDNLFQRRVMGLVSYYESTAVGFPDVKVNDLIRVDMSDYQFSDYNFVREIEKKTEKGGKKKSKEKTASYFRVLSRMFSNFVFPPEIERPWKNEKLVAKMKQLKAKNKITIKDAKEVMANTSSEESESNNNSNNDSLKKQAKASKKYTTKLKTALEKLSNSPVYLRPGPNGLDKYSPKMNAILSNIMKSEGLVFIYSDFRSVEGVEIFMRVLEASGFSQFNYKKGGAKSVNNANANVNVNANANANAKNKNKNNGNVNANNNEPVGNNKHNDNSANSPKSSNNKSTNGSNNGKSNSKQSFKQVTPYKQFGLYSGSESMDEKREIVRVFNDPDNKEGKNLKILLATSAGSEGLDLHNIRQIHIMDTYWNEIRIEQVIGRGVRRNSHVDLPPAKRNVEVFRYMSVFKQSHKIKAVDKVSTDEHILALAQKKKILTDDLLELLKETSIDCVLNKAEIKGSYKCFSYDKGATGLSTVPDIRANRSLDTKATKLVETKLKRVFMDKEGYIIVPNKTTRKLYRLMDRGKKTPIEKKTLTKTVLGVKLKEKEVYSKDGQLIGTFDSKGVFKKK